MKASTNVRAHTAVLFAVALLLTAQGAALFSHAERDHRPSPPRRWVLDETHTLAGLGRAQGAAVHDGKLYVYGDADTGVIVEFTLELEPTGRRIALTRDRRDLISHPTGLAIHPRYGAFLGDSPRGLFGQRAMLYQIDWEQALAEGTLDHAVRAVIRDNAARAGTRPVFVRWGARWMLATADYARRGHVRLYDPEKLRDGSRITDAGVLVRSFALAGRTQSLVWEDETGWLYCVQNPSPGRGWRVLVVDLEKALAAGRYDAPGALIEQREFPFNSELEGLALLPGNRLLFLTSEERDNARLGHLEEGR
ncbi:MAG: hypothetical protein ACE5IP_05185 [Terriglobia bacterium]